ncbi:unnamed protein product, partial [Tetraodon nigroviridis]
TPPCSTWITCSPRLPRPPWPPTPPAPTSCMWTSSTRPHMGGAWTWPRPPRRWRPTSCRAATPPPGPCRTATTTSRRTRTAPPPPPTKTPTAPPPTLTRATRTCASPPAPGVAPSPAPSSRGPALPCPSSRRRTARTARADAAWASRWWTGAAARPATCSPTTASTGGSATSWRGWEPSAGTPTHRCFLVPHV